MTPGSSTVVGSGCTRDPSEGESFPRSVVNTDDDPRHDHHYWYYYRRYCCHRMSLLVKNIRFEKSI